MYLGEEIHVLVLAQLESGSLGRMEMVCKAFAAPRPALTSIQRAIQKKLRMDFPGCTLERMTDAHLFSKLEHAKAVAENWDDEKVVGDVHRIFENTQADGSVLGERDGHAGGVKKMVQKLRQRSGNNYRQLAIHSKNCCYLIRAMARLAARDRNRDALISAGVVPPLVKLLADGIEDTHLSAPSRKDQTIINTVTLLSRLSGSSRHQHCLVSAGVIAQLVSILRKENSNEAKKHCATALAKIMNSEHHDKVVNAGAVNPIINLLKEGSPAAKSEAAFAISRIAVKKRHHRALIVAGVASPLVAVMREDYAEEVDNAGWSGWHRSDPLGMAPKKYACSAVARILSSECHRDAMVAAGAVPALVFLLDKKWQNETRANAATALSRISVGDHKDAVMEANALEPLIELLKKGSSDGKESAASALSRILSAEKHRGDFIVAGAIELLVHLLSTGTCGQRTNAASALSRILASDAHRDRVMEAGVLKPLISLLSKSNGGKWQEAREKSISACSRIANDEKYAGILVSSGLLPLLVQALHDGTERCVERATLTVCRILVSQKHVNDVVKAGAIEPLVRLLHNSRNSNIFEVTSISLARIVKSGNQDHCAAVAAAGSVPTSGPVLLQVLRHFGNAEEKLRADLEKAGKASQGLPSPI